MLGMQRNPTLQSLDLQNFGITEFGIINPEITKLGITEELGTAGNLGITEQRVTKELSITEHWITEIKTTELGITRKLGFTEAKITEELGITQL